MNMPVSAERNDIAEEIRAVRALAHPLRLKLLDLLRFEGPSTATLLARRLGESSGATSYHLRLLARYGFVVEAAKMDNRERWWRHRERPVVLPSDQGASQEASGETATSGERRLLAELLSREAHALDRYLARHSHQPEFDAIAFFRVCAVRLTAAEFAAVQQGLMDLLATLRRADVTDAPEGAVPIRILAFGFPEILEDS
jgi:DNA-binding transcriptional ArsR family regulator